MTEEPDNDKHDETVAPPEPEDPESPDNDPVEEEE